jgi:formate-nitrite transporter family protein
MAQLSKPVSEQDHKRGPENAPVTLVEYGDFECEHCAAAYPVINALLNEIGDQICFVYRHFPLTQAHPHAQRAAEAAEAAAAQDSFWEMHDMIFTNQDALDDESLSQYAEKIGLDMQQFNQEMESQTHTARVKDDFQSGIRSGVNGTPTFFINGERYDGPISQDALFEAVEQAAQRA